VGTVGLARPRWTSCGRFQDRFWCGLMVLYSMRCPRPAWRARRRHRSRRYRAARTCACRPTARPDSVRSGRTRTWPYIRQQPQHARLRHDVPVVADHRPDLAMPPRRMRQRVLAHQPGRRRTYRRGHGPSGSCSARALAYQRRQLHSGMSISWQNLAVDVPASTRITSRSSKGPGDPRRTSSRPAPASPSARVSSASSASSCCSRVDGSDLPATRPVLPASRKSAFHRPIDCSLIFSDLLPACRLGSSPHQPACSARPGSWFQPE
jgi:hypothetical protein